MIGEFKFGRDNGINWAEPGIVWGDNLEMRMFRCVGGDSYSYNVLTKVVSNYVFNKSLMDLVNEGCFVYVYQVISLTDGTIYRSTNPFDSNKDLTGHLLRGIIIN